MLTGDRAEAAETIGAALDLDAVLADREPADKVDAVASEQRRHPTVMVGDGINDAPALAAANVGIAMGARGASASSEAADVVILVDRLDRVSDAVVIAKRTQAVALQRQISARGRRMPCPFISRICHLARPTMATANSWHSARPSISAACRTRILSSPEWDFRRWLWRSLQWGICRPSLVR